MSVDSARPAGADGDNAQNEPPASRLRGPPDSQPVVSGSPSRRREPRDDVTAPLLRPTCACAPRLQTLSGMSASDELDDSQVRQMLFDLESAYNAFNRFLHA